MQKRDPRFDSEISGCSGAEEHGKFFPLAGRDIFVDLTDVVLLSAKLHTHICMGMTCAYKKGLVLELTLASSEETLGRTPALLTEGHRVPRQDADHTRECLELSSLAESSSSAPDSDSRFPERLPDFFIASLVLWNCFPLSYLLQVLFGGIALL